MRRVLLWVLLLAPLMACTALPTPRQSTERDEELSELKRRVLELQRQSAVAAVEIERLEERLAALEGRPVSRRVTPAPVRESARPDAPPPVEPRLAPAEPEVARAAAGGREEPPPSGVEDEDLEIAPVPVEPGLPGRPFPSDEGPAARREEPSLPSPDRSPAPGPGATADEEVTAEARALYDQGFTHFHEGRYVDAETAFQRYLQQYPRTELADNASYWIGEARLQRQDVRGALAAYRQTVERYPQGNKIPDALLKAGECLESLGDSESARLSYEEIIERFPSSAASEVAKARRARLN